MCEMEGKKKKKKKKKEGKKKRRQKRKGPGSQDKEAIGQGLLHLGGTRHSSDQADRS